jgi:hypothetical protein
MKITNPTTVADIDLPSHRKYAKNISNYDETQGKEASHIRKLTELAGTSSIYVSELNALLGINQTPGTWSSFSPPEGYENQTNHFFFLRPFPSKKTPTEEFDVLTRMSSSFSQERDQKTIKAFADAYKQISDLIAEAYTRILALQKS